METLREVQSKRTGRWVWLLAKRNRFNPTKYAVCVSGCAKCFHSTDVEQAGQVFRIVRDSGK
jgi:hypothetical protein